LYQKFNKRAKQKPEKSGKRMGNAGVEPRTNPFGIIRGRPAIPSHQFDGQ